MMLLFWVSMGCKPIVTAKPALQEMVQYRPLEDSTYQSILESVLPNATIDSTLQKASQTLISATRNPMHPLSVDSMVKAEKQAGYPSQAHFMKVMNSGDFPTSYLSHLRNVGPIDIGVSTRKFADGRVLWIIGWGKHILEMDPIPLSLPLDGVLPLRIGEFDADRAILYIASPDQPVERIELLPEAHRWLQNFHVPGEYRLEVLLQDTEGAQQSNKIALLFSVFVDTPLPSVHTTSINPDVPNPIQAEQELFMAVNALRRERHLHPLKPFELFVPLAREHSALMAATGTVQHRITGVTDGVPERAANMAHPRANHYQNVAAARTAKEALALAIDSPGHFQVFLCESCTHMSIGAALEPTYHPNPRLYVTWEVLEFSRGEPQRIEKLNRDY